MLDNVKKRKNRIAKANFDEKMSHELSPYQTICDLPLLEEHLFNKNATDSVYMFSSLRDRYCLLMTTMSILRGESLFLCDLSNYCDIIFRPAKKPVDTLVHVMRVATGNANGLKTLYGRCVRSKDVTLCQIGAFGFYLLSCFNMTK